MNLSSIYIILAFNLLFINTISSQSCNLKDDIPCDNKEDNSDWWKDGSEDYYDDYSPKFILGWLKSQMKKMVNTCHAEFLIDENEEKNALKIVKETYPCQESEKTNWSGKFDKEGLPKGQGNLQKIKTVKEKQNIKLISTNGQMEKCVDLGAQFENYRGSFKKGSPSGFGYVTYEYDESSIHGSLVNGYFHGKVDLFHKKGSLLYTGVYRHGRANGPGWIIPSDWETSGFVQTFFKNGSLQDFPTFYFNPDLTEVMVGTLNGTILENARVVKNFKTGDFNCIQFFELKKESQYEEMESNQIRLPVVIKSDAKNGAIFVRSSKKLIFNRIAKTGSQSIIELLVQSEHETEIKPNIIIKQVEILMEPPRMVGDFVAMVDSDPNPGSYIRHYNFVNFHKYGAFHNPIYINIVRHPVDRIISWFYYWRAAWNIVERIKAFPREPLPDSKFLRKDFDTCVLTGDPECQYIQGSNVMDYNDHRSQMMAFCGHEPFCSEFNSDAVLRKAKENVEKYYTVVGVLENMNKTLAVLEKKLPDFFPDAQHLYMTNEKIKQKQNRNAYKLPVSQTVIDIVYKNFTKEIEFYDFLKQRLDKQYDLL